MTRSQKTILFSIFIFAAMPLPGCKKLFLSSHTNSTAPLESQEDFPIDNTLCASSSAPEIELDTSQSISEEKFLAIAQSVASNEGECTPESFAEESDHGLSTSLAGVSAESLKKSEKVLSTSFEVFENGKGILGTIRLKTKVIRTQIQLNNKKSVLAFTESKGLLGMPLKLDLPKDFPALAKTVQTKSYTLALRSRMKLEGFYIAGKGNVTFNEIHISYSLQEGSTAIAENFVNAEALPPKYQNQLKSMFGDLQQELKNYVKNLPEGTVVVLRPEFSQQSQVLEESFIKRFGFGSAKRLGEMRGLVFKGQLLPVTTAEIENMVRHSKP